MKQKGQQRKPKRTRAEMERDEVAAAEAKAERARKAAEAKAKKMAEVKAKEQERRFANFTTRHVRPLLCGDMRSPPNRHVVLNASGVNQPDGVLSGQLARLQVTPPAIHAYSENLLHHKARTRVTEVDPSLDRVL